ncbi:hypothetical protein [Oligella urethralis]|uniref:hypothetical protein n=1 Tax=Oligella urethralis TaxID=90245 RepID=UPI00288A84FF|nr:hypothetical protein [Oligella urethralis]
MKNKLILSLALSISASSVAAKDIAINVSMPGAINPFYGYQMKYQDVDRSHCFIKFTYTDEGLAYLKSTSPCPSFVTEEQVKRDADNALKHMKTVSEAYSFFEFTGSDGYGKTTERAKYVYRCAYVSSVTPYNIDEWAGVPMHNTIFVFMPTGSPDRRGWYELDIINGRSYTPKVGIWKLDDNYNIIGNFLGRKFTADKYSTKCRRHRYH